MRQALPLTTDLTKARPIHICGEQPRLPPHCPRLSFQSGWATGTPQGLITAKAGAFVECIPSSERLCYALSSDGTEVSRWPKLLPHTVLPTRPCHLGPGNGRTELALACSRNGKGTKGTHITPSYDMKKAFFFLLVSLHLNPCTFPASLEQQSRAGLGICSCLGVTHLPWHSSGLLLPARPGREGRWPHKNSRGALEVPLLQLLC